MDKILVTLALIGTAACSCPANPSGVAVSSYKYAEEREAAISAVVGSERDYVESVRVYESDDPSRDCPDGANMGCYCYTPFCASIIIGPTVQSDTALHEFVHAALDSAGSDDPDHGPLFRSAEAAARSILNRH